jgi:hypothetical protein
MSFYMQTPKGWKNRRMKKWDATERNQRHRAKMVEKLRARHVNANRLDRARRAESAAEVPF